MKTVDMPKEFTSFTPTDQHYIKKFEELNAGRASDMKFMRTRNKRIALLMGGFVMGICILSNQNNFNDWHRTSYGYLKDFSIGIVPVFCMLLKHCIWLNKQRLFQY